MRLTDKFKNKPTIYYAMSIAASWAGVGSLMNSVTMTQDYGIVPSLIWALCNSLACIIFGLIICKLETFRNIMKTKVARYCLAILAIFQLWLNMNGIREIWGDTAIGETGGTIIVYVVCIVFILILLTSGMIRNVLTDTASWIIVYIFVAVVVVAAFIVNGFGTVDIGWGLEAENMTQGIWKGFLLLPGPFTFPYFYTLVDYNDKNEDETNVCNVKNAFIMGGVMFGIYMIFAFSAAFATFGPVLSVLRALLITIIAISSISTHIYSQYVIFGKKIGVAIDVAAVIFWPLLIGLGVMGVWTLVSNIRMYPVVIVLIVSLIIDYRNKRKAKKNESNKA